MNEQILINVTPQETRVAVTEQGAVQELHVERDSSRGIVGNVYLGRVCRVLPGMQSAFVEIGLARAAFLHVADIWMARNGDGQVKPIEKILSEGQALLVQVVKDPIGSKGARLSTQVSIAGGSSSTCRRTPTSASRSASRTSPSARTCARRCTRSSRGRVGGLHRPHRRRDRDRRRAQGRHRLPGHPVEADPAGRHDRGPQAVLYQDLALATRVLRDLVTDTTERVIVDSRENFHRLKDFAAKYTRKALPILEHYAGERPLFDLFGVEEEIEKALARRVDLKSGGYLIIDQTEALTTVDVNTGGFVSGRSFDDTIFKTNLEAAQSIARQLRLRNLGGIIIVDFIDMDTQEHRDAVLAEFRKALARDRTRVTVNGFSQLGLVEMTRKRTRESLAHVLCEPCPVCVGRGELKTAQTICYEILREILRTERQFGAKEYRILASQKVIDMFLDEESNALTMLGDFISKPISMQVETAYTQEQYDVILV